ncbi:MAG: hypothetical protein H5U08_10780, partial [Thermogutta sp.]|uniref:hypothetical protein n=1 Tax=Thermogutta sp. TaxID=1962930 RepID=UPI001993DD80
AMVASCPVNYAAVVLLLFLSTVVTPQIIMPLPRNCAEVPESNPAIDSLFLFTGRSFDSDTQLQNNLNRWYDARVGRWVQIGWGNGRV